MIKAIIFDCFGVIRPDGLIAAYRHFGGDPVADAKFINETIDAANKGVIPKARIVFAQHFHVTPEEFMAVYERGADNDQQVLDYCLALRKQYKVGLLTNMSKGRLFEVFDSRELAKYFDAAVSSGEIGYAKPEATAYEIVADKLGVRLDECVMVDDRQDYCEGARAVGMQAVQFVSFDQAKRELQGLGVDVA